MTAARLGDGRDELDGISLKPTTFRLPGIPFAFTAKTADMLDNARARTNSGTKTIPVT
jgi:hypothetical protein